MKLFIHRSQALGHFKHDANFWLYLLIGIDILFLTLHVGSALGYLDISFSVARSFGYGEIFQYLKFGLLAIALAYLAYQWQSTLLGCWSVLFLFLLIDDSVEIHEHAGASLAQLIGPLTTINPEILLSLAEAAILLSMGVMLIIPVLILHFQQGRHSLTRLISQDIVLLMVIMAFFSIVVDFFHGFATPKSMLRGALTLVEEGGEMISISLITWYVAYVAKNHTAIRHKALSLTIPTNYPTP